MKYLLLFLCATSAFAQSYNPGLPLPGLPKSVGPKPMSGSTSVTLASDQIAITVSAAGKVPFNVVRNIYRAVNVTAGAYVQLVASLSSPATSLDIFDSSGQTLAIAYGAAGSESNKFYIYPGGNGLIPVAIPQGTRVSVIAISPSATSASISPTASSGELDINFYD